MNPSNRINRILTDFYGLVERYGGTNDSQDDMDILSDEIIAQAYEEGAINDLINTADIQMNILDFSDIDPQFYTVLTNTYVDCDDRKFESEQQARDIYTIECHAAYDDAYNQGTDSYDIYKDGMLIRVGLPTKSQADDWISEAVEDEVDRKIENLEKIPDEMIDPLVYEIPSMQYDFDVARQCHLGVLETSAGRRYIFLKKGTRNDTPYIIAYQALRYGAVDEQFRDQFTSCGSVDWPRTVLGEPLYSDVLKAIGVDVMRLKLSQYAKPNN